MHKVQVTPLIGLPQVEGWATVTSTQSGTLVWALAVAGLHARNVGKDLFDTINETIVHDAADLYRLIEDLDRIAADKQALVSVAACWLGETFGIHAALRARILLKRGEKVGKMIAAEDTTAIMQGKLLQDDVFVALTERSLEFSEEIQLKLQRGYGVDSTISSVTPTVHGAEDSSEVAIAFIEIGAHFEPEVEAEPLREQYIELNPDQENSATFDHQDRQYDADADQDAEYDFDQDRDRDQDRDEATGVSDPQLPEPVQETVIDVGSMAHQGWAKTKTAVQAIPWQTLRARLGGVGGAVGRAGSSLVRASTAALANTGLFSQEVYVTKPPPGKLSA